MARRSLTVWLLALALVAAQALGFAHRVAHGHGQGQGHGLGTATAVSSGDLFAGHEGQPACLLYDQLSGTAITPAVPVLCTPVIPPAFYLAVAQGEALARFAALFDARGPPSLR